MSKGENQRQTCLLTEHTGDREREMGDSLHVRWGWLRFMYIYTIIGAGGFGLGMLFFPDIVQSAFGFPSQDPVVFGLAGSVYTAFGLLSFPGLKSPLQFVPVLLLQLCYKVIWLLAVILPLFLSGRFPPYATLLVITFTTYIVGDLIAIPFSHVFSERKCT